MDAAAVGGDLMRILNRYAAELFPDRQRETQLLPNLAQRACEVPGQAIVVERRRRDPRSLGSLWHGRIVDRLQVNRDDELGAVRRGLPSKNSRWLTLLWRKIRFSARL
jgi:hypothetical protein